MEDWAYWINQPIFIDRGVQYAKRKHILYRFCKEGLIPLIESAGYKLEYTDSKFYHAFLSMLFLLSKGHTLRPVTVEIPYQEEQYAEFHYRLDSEVWESFWKRWGCIQDFDEDNYAHRLQYELAEFIWSWIDFDTSPRIEALYVELQQDDFQEEMSKGKDDPYLQETSKRDYQDRHW
jgi:hypothetical protein